MLLTEKEAESLLEKEGFNVIKRQIIRKRSQLLKLNLNFPLVAKISSRHIIHKSKINGVILNIKDLKGAENSLKKLFKIKGCEEIMFQEMLQGQEVILGLKKTLEFGLVILVGKGGSNVEKEKDVSFRVLPIDKSDAYKMLNELRTKIKNKDKVVENILKLSNLAKRYKIEELDINPLIVSNKEAVIADARMVLKKINNHPKSGNLLYKNASFHKT